MDKAAIQDILREFGIKARVTGVKQHIFYNDLAGKPPEYKLVAGLSFYGHSPLILKCLKEERTTPAYLSEQYHLSELFLRHHIPTAKRRLLPGGQDHMTFSHQRHSLLVSLEEDLGPEIPLATLPLCRQAGALLGRMHLALMDEDFHMQEGKAIFDFARDSDVDAGRKLASLLKDHGRLAESLEVQRLYDSRQQELLSCWYKLPHYGVQGDLSINNLVWTKPGELGVFDYNCAGEAPLLSDAVLQGLLFAREMPYDPLDKPSDSDARFAAFFGAYRTQRTLTAEEESLWQPLYQAADAFWFTRYFYRENSLVQRLQQDPQMPLTTAIQHIKDLLVRKPPD